MTNYRVRLTETIEYEKTYSKEELMTLLGLHSVLSDDLLLVDFRAFVPKSDEAYADINDHGETINLQWVVLEERDKPEWRTSDC